MTPNQKWLDAMNGRQPLIPPKTKANERIFWRMHHDTRELNEKGISLFNLKYSSRELSKQSRYSRNGEKKQFGIRYQKADISRIAVFDGDRYLCDAYASELRLTDGSYRHMSLAELDMTKAIAKLNGLNSSTISDLLKHIDDLDEVTKVRRQEKKQAQKKPMPNNLPQEASTTRDILIYSNSEDLDESNDKNTKLLATFGPQRKRIPNQN